MRVRYCKSSNRYFLTISEVICQMYKHTVHVCWIRICNICVAFIIVMVAWKGIRRYYRLREIKQIVRERGKEKLRISRIILWK